uniref:Uncharacterized protein n=1 Tax=Aegilops tauschii TaxID=37682 RepID=R7WAF0_AEGTA
MTWFDQVFEKAKSLDHTITHQQGQLVWFSCGHDIFTELLRLVLAHTFVFAKVLRNNFTMPRKINNFTSMTWFYQVFEKAKSLDHTFTHQQVREGSSDGEGKKVDPRCPNAPNPFHVCTNHCLAKIVEGGRSSEGGKSPISLFSRHSGRSTSSSEDGSVKSGGSKKADSKCPNSGNPFHECGEHCTTKMKELEKQKKADKKSPRKKGGKDGAVVQNWKVDPRCPNAGNPFHICAQYCFDHLNEAPSTPKSKPDSRKGKAVMKSEPTGEINPDCVNASNPYHKCGEYCKRNGNR